MVSSVSCIGLLAISMMILMVQARPSLDFNLEDFGDQQKDMDVIYDEVDRSENDVDEVTECVDYKSSPGIYKVFSEIPRPKPCGLYLVAPVDQQIELTFLDFQVHCQQHGIVEIVDGYAYGNGIFPPQEGSGQTSRIDRHKRYCGAHKPSSVFLSTSNAAVIQNRMPNDNEGFTVQVKFIKNPQPCNAVAMEERGVVTLTNYGLAHNCSLLILFPQRLSVTFGYTQARAEVPPRHHGQGSDYLEILGGNSSSVDKMISFERSAGLSSDFRLKRRIPCENVVVRLISSGRFINSAQIHHETLSQDETSGSSRSQCFL
ncbi:hypothetical protein RvY_01009 [Ramazzottius varieornatus]|uniref:Corticotropin-releasing factor-binding protein n=1 Tax=Ramazzottius varieornatus TaxID=947166 RepID=A0A1D1UIS7_RAMVA|nr:hypothetical protein RvY_01009 [Ramazzottius varieornatus]